MIRDKSGMLWNGKDYPIRQVQAALSAFAVNPAAKCLTGPGSYFTNGFDTGMIHGPEDRS